MINGIRVLAEIPIYIIEYSAGWSWIGFGLGISALFSLIVAIISIINGGLGDGILFITFFMILTFSSFFCFKTENSIEIFDHTEYKVLINEEVNFIEFNEKYEIINQEGEIFTITEKLQD